MAIDIGSVENARELIFSQGHSDSNRYVLQSEDVKEDYLTFISRFPAQAARTPHYYIDDTDGQWFACYVVDCFDPPFAVIRARSFEAAYEAFCDEFSDWMKVDDTDAQDYPEDERHYNGSGVHIDTDSVQIYPMRLLSIEFY